MYQQERPVIESLEPRTHAMEYPVPPKWARTVIGIVYAFAISIAVFNLAGN